MKDKVILELSEFESLMLEGAIESAINLHLRKGTSIFKSKKEKQTQVSIMGTFWSLKRRLITATESNENSGPHLPTG